MNILNYILMPLSGAVIGYFTNWLAIKMLFLPHNEIRFKGIKLPFTPGLIPKERYRLAEKVSQTVSEHLLTKDVLTKSISKANNIEELAERLFNEAAKSDKSIGEYINKSDLARDIIKDVEAKALDVITGITENPDEFWEKNEKLDKTIKTALYKILDDNLSVIANLFINREKVYKNLKESLFTYIKNQTSATERILDIKIGVILRDLSEEKALAVKQALAHILTRLIKKGASYAAEAIDVRALTENQINSLDLVKAEEIVISVAKRELDAITYLGGVLGFIIGLLPVIYGIVS